MKKRIKKIALIGFTIFLLMQCYQPARNIGFEQYFSSNFTEVYKVPKNVETTLRTSCYDCHSNNINYLWILMCNLFVSLWMDILMRERKN